MTKEELKEKISRKRKALKGLDTSKSTYPIMKKTMEKQIKGWEDDLSKLESEDKPKPKTEDKPKPKAEDKPKPKTEDKPKPKAEDKPKPKPRRKPKPKKSLDEDCDEVLEAWKKKSEKETSKLEKENRELKKKLDSSSGGSKKGGSSAKKTKPKKKSADDMLVGKAYGLIHLVGTRKKVKGSLKSSDLKSVERHLIATLRACAKSTGLNEKNVVSKFKAKTAKYFESIDDKNKK